MKLADRWTVFAICTALAGVSWAVFGQTLGHSFVNFDDYDYVLKNPQVTAGLTWKGAVWAFTHLHAANWHPLTWLSHMIDCQLYGLHPRGHHLTSVLLHTTTSVLLFLVLKEATGVIWRSAFVAAVFCIHPLRVESVAWVAERKDVLSALFFVLTIGAYTRYTRHPSRGRYLLVVFVYALGLMSKPMLVTVPFVLLLWDYWPLQRFPGSSNTQFRAPRSWQSLFFEKLPLLLLAAAVSVATLFAQRGALQPVSSLSLPIRLGNALISCIVYIVQMGWPVHLAAFYPIDAHAVTAVTTGVVSSSCSVHLPRLLGQKPVATWSPAGSGIC